MTTIKKGKKLFLLFVGAVIALALFQVSIASADNSNAIQSNGGRNGETSFDISHLQLDSKSFFYTLENPVYCSTWGDDGKTYDFSDSDGKYELSNMWMNLRTNDDNEELVQLIYDVDTPRWDNDSDIFAVFSIYVDGKLFKTCFHEWKVTIDRISGCEVLYKVKKADFKSQIGCSLCEGLENGRIVIQMDDLVCNTH